MEWGKIGIGITQLLGPAIVNNSNGHIFICFVYTVYYTFVLCARSGIDRKDNNGILEIPVEVIQCLYK